MRDAPGEVYRWDAKGGVWSHVERESHWDYSDGSDVEGRLYDLVASATDRSVLSAELAARMADWPTRYYFSAQRANLLRPFSSLLQGGTVLEVGAGCGAVTRYLGETAGDVVALEPAPARARVASERCRDLGNVSVVVDDLESFHGQCERQFDVVTLIGVLEYAHRFSSRSDAATHWLRLARSLLRPGGCLILAIENKLGLKYYAGAPEDHLGRPMLGVADLYEPEGPRTWGRRELEGMLAEAGFGSCGVALPFPDYKLPDSVLLGRDGDAMPGFDGGVALASAAADMQLGRAPLFPLDRAWRGAAANGLLGDLANSFLMVAHAGRTEHPFGVANAGVSAYHFSARRKARFAKQARFQIENGQAWVRRSMLAPGLPMQDDAGFVCTPSDEPYIVGQAWSDVLYRSLLRDGWTIDELFTWFEGWIEQLLLHERMAVPAIGSGAELLLSGRAVDLLPQNLLQTGDGFRFIDLEWVAVGETTLGFVAFRSLYITLSRCLGVARPAEPRYLAIPELVADLMRRLGDDPVADVAPYLEQERSFQGVVSAEPVELSQDAYAHARLIEYDALQTEGPLAAVLAKARETGQELEALRPRHERLQSEFEERSRWAERSAAERDEIGAAYQQLQIEFEERSRWAERSAAERDEIGAAYQQLQADFHARGLWAQNLDVEIAALRERVSEQQQTLAGTVKELARLQGDLERVFASRSWRLTRPLRAITRLLGGGGD